MAAQQKKHIRTIIRKVHPDLFEQHPYERERNSESLQALNQYVDLLSAGLLPRKTSVQFWVKDSAGLKLVKAELPSSGNLSPLFHAFGLINEQELKAALTRRFSDSVDTDFFAWLRKQVSAAVTTAQQYEVLKAQFKQLRALVENKFRLAALQVGNGIATSLRDLRHNIDALTSLEACLAQLSREENFDFQGLNIRVYHPDTKPPIVIGDEEGGSALQDGKLTTHVAEDGCLHVVADRNSIAEDVRGLNVERARVLTSASMYWVKRVEELSPVLKEVLGVAHVWCDTRTELATQQFVLWAGRILDQRHMFMNDLQQRHFSFGLWVHCDTSEPMLDCWTTHSVVQLRADCPAEQLLDFLASDKGSKADEVAVDASHTRLEEEQLLETVRKALGAKHVICVACVPEKDRVLAGARRLLEFADKIRETVSLEGASIAIDDCYEVWGTGFISIPYDFEVSDLRPQLAQLMGGNMASAQDYAATEEYAPAVHPAMPEVAESLASPALRGYAASGGAAAVRALPHQHWHLPIGSATHINGMFLQGHKPATVRRVQAHIRNRQLAVRSLQHLHCVFR